ncbi:MAG: SRPBCC family protein [Paracoccus sp. (in: a-proteobacteria)]|nr:SRPBCC family protein [Paracoccus sp. (in: a-proteobacteria)]
MRQKITVQTTINAPVMDVWRAYVTPADIMAWNAASDDWHTTSAKVDLREGGTFSSRMEAKDGSMSFDFAGSYTKILPGKLIEYEFGGRVATVEFISAGDGVTVRVSFDPEDTHSLVAQRAGWQAILDSFARYVTQSHAAGA